MSNFAPTKKAFNTAFNTILIKGLCSQEWGFALQYWSTITVNTGPKLPEGKPSDQYFLHYVITVRPVIFVLLHTSPTSFLN